jgi:drug/metabolite transporter (DMT)-like permease
MWATTAGFGAILMWSATVALTRSISEQFGPLATGSIIFTCSGALSLLAGLFLPKPSRQNEKQTPFNKRYILGCGGLFLLYTLSFFLAIGLARDRAQAIELALLNYLWPSLTILFSLAVLPVRATWSLLPGLALAFGGIVLVMIPAGDANWKTFADHLWGNPVAYGAALTAGVTWALYSVLTRRMAPSDGGGAPLFMLISGIALGALALANGLSWKAVSRQTSLELAALILSTAAAYALWDTAMRRGRVTRVAAASNFTPLLSTLVSCAYLGILPAAHVWVGSSVIAAGSLISWKSVSEKKPRKKIP